MNQEHYSNVTYIIIHLIIHGANKGATSVSLSTIRIHGLETAKMGSDSPSEPATNLPAPAARAQAGGVAGYWGTQPSNHAVPRSKEIWAAFGSRNRSSSDDRNSF